MTENRPLGQENLKESTVDSLGWAYYRLGNMEEAVKQLERAVELKPEPEDLVKIEAKLKSGLPDDTSSAAEAEHKKPGGG